MVDESGTGSRLDDEDYGDEARVWGARDRGHWSCNYILGVVVLSVGVVQIELP